MNGVNCDQRWRQREREDFVVHARSEGLRDADQRLRSEAGEHFMVRRLYARFALAATISAACRRAR
jgi:hypothetical protein